MRDSSRLTLVTPTDGATVDLAPQILQWNNGFVDVYYYEVQVSSDPNFGEQGPVSSVWYNLVHGGVSNPLNSWTTPELTGTDHLLLPDAASCTRGRRPGGMGSYLEL